MIVFYHSVDEVLVPSKYIARLLHKRGLRSRKLLILDRWVDTQRFHPGKRQVGYYATHHGLADEAALVKFVYVGRVAVEKNLEAFLSLDLPGTKMIIGTGPQEAELKSRFPAAQFMGLIENGKLAAHLASADVFVFPSLTDTFGVVQLEALASGVPIAAFPVTGPKDVVGGNPIGALNEDLRAACLAALNVSREACRSFALGYSWDNSARQFIGNLRDINAGRRAQSAQLGAAAPAHG